MLDVESFLDFFENKLKEQNLTLRMLAVRSGTAEMHWRKILADVDKIGDFEIYQFTKLFNTSEDYWRDIIKQFSESKKIL